MKAVLGMLFILVGITTGWLVLSGKLPNAAAASSATGTAASAPTDAQINARYRNQGTPASKPFTIQPSPGGLKVS